MAAAAPHGKARVAVLFSGGGRTLENLVHASRRGLFPGEVVTAISSHPEAGGLARAERLGVPSAVVNFRLYGEEEFNRRIYELVEAAGAEWIALGGFIRRIAVPERYRWRILNIHPALLPAFGGKGFWGERVHKAVLEAGVPFSGCTVHFVTEEYDSGPIILQRVVPVDPRDTPQTLADRVFREECIAYPEALDLAIRGRLAIEDGRVRIR